MLWNVYFLVIVGFKSRLSVRMNILIKSTIKGTSKVRPYNEFRSTPDIICGIQYPEIGPEISHLIKIRLALP